MCPFAMFQTKNPVAVSMGCSGKAVVNNYVSRAVVTIYSELVQGNHIQLGKTLGREKRVHLPAEHHLNRLK